MVLQEGWSSYFLTISIVRLLGLSCIGAFPYHTVRSGNNIMSNLISIWQKRQVIYHLKSTIHHQHFSFCS